MGTLLVMFSFMGILYSMNEWMVGWMGERIREGHMYTNELVYETETDSQTCGCQGGGGGGMDWEFGIRTCKLLYT